MFDGTITDADATLIDEEVMRTEANVEDVFSFWTGTPSTRCDHSLLITCASAEILQAPD
jgi:hypothetical protein